MFLFERALLARDFAQQGFQAFGFFPLLFPCERQPFLFLGFEKRLPVGPMAGYHLFSFFL